jgi:small-conductance mechanosensitive channel
MFQMVTRTQFERPGSRLLLTLLIILVVGVKPALTQTSKKTTPTPTPTPESSPVPTVNPLVIGVPEIATAILQLNQSMRTLSERSVTEESLNQLEQQLQGIKEKTGKRAVETESAIQSGAIFVDLQQSSQDWEDLRKELDEVSTTLTRRSTELENEVKSFTNEEARWRATNEAVNSQESPIELRDLTAKAVADIETTRTILQQRRDRVIAMQQSAAAQGSLIANEIDHLRKAMAQSQRSLMEPESPRLWKVQFGTHAEDSLTRRLLRGSYTEDFSRVVAFLRENRTPLLIIFLICIGLLGFFIRLSRATKVTNIEAQHSILRRPVSLSFLIFLVAIMPLLYDAPLSVIGMANLLGVIPVIRLLGPQLSKPYQRMLISLVVSVLFFHLTKFVQFPTWVKRDLLVLLTIAVVGVFLWLRRQALSSGNPSRREKALTHLAIFVGVTLLGLAVLANVFGYVRLSDLLTQGTLVGAYRGVALYTIFVVGRELISFTFQSQTTKSLAIFQTGSERVSGRLSFALGLAISLIWIHTVLNLFAIREDVYRTISSLMNYQISIGSAGFKVSNVVAFVMTLLVGYLAASIFRAILGDEILPRFNLGRGVPNAIATVSYYCALVLIFLLALAASGVELSKFTVLTGAFGVGLGFGLQNVVNNFVSGLILLFERPVRVGDILDIGGIGGEVTKIGFRSSTLHAFDGSDVIIPNAALISERVVNWTLTGTRRQILLNVHVAYGNDPAKVRDILRNTTASHPDVLDYPKPTAFFLGFGDNALRFEIRFWAPRPEVAAELRSDVALSIAAELDKAGIKVPIVQRDILPTTSEQRQDDSVPKDDGTKRSR